MSDLQNKAAFDLPYSPAHQVGNTYYISGHTGVDIPTKTASDDVAQQTKKVFANLAETLQNYELSFDDIVKTTVFLTDMSDFSTVNDIYATYFRDSKPARTTVAVRELPRVANIPLRIEIEAIAVKSN